MSNVLINGRTAVHAGSDGILNTVDVCKTQVGPAVVPIPYPMNSSPAPRMFLLKGNPLYAWVI